MYPSNIFSVSRWPVFDASGVIKASKTHLESALKGKVKRSKESATAFQVQNIYSRGLNLYIGVLL